MTLHFDSSVPLKKKLNEDESFLMIRLYGGGGGGIPGAPCVVFDPLDDNDGYETLLEREQSGIDDDNDNDDIDSISENSDISISNSSANTAATNSDSDSKPQQVIERSGIICWHASRNQHVHIMCVQLRARIVRYC